MEVIKPKQRFKIGIIGAGSIVENSHLPVLKNISSVEATWIYDRNTERSSLLSKMFGLRVVGEANLIDEIKNVDICLLAIPYGARKKYIEICASFGNAVYAEKPFALTLNEHADYCKLFPKGKLAIGFQRRYYKTVEVLKSIVNSNVFGQLLEVDYKQGYFNLKGGGYLADAALAGGGVTIETGIHALDQILLITAAQSVTCRSVQCLKKKGIDYDTTVVSDIVNNDQTIHVTTEFSAMRNLDNGLVLRFDRAAVRCSLSPNATIEIHELMGEGNRFELSQNQSFFDRADSVSESFFLFWMDWIKAIESNNSNLTTGDSSLLTTGWVEQIYSAK